MDTNYKLKYLKYKNKYINLQKNISSFNLFGGANKHIIFGCTYINDSSTYDTKFDLINDTINKLIPIHEIKQPHFITTQIYGPPKQELITKMNENNYIITENSETFNKTSIIDYINSEFVLKEKNIDVLVLTQCNDFLSSFLQNPDTYYNYMARYKDLSKLMDYKELFDLLKINLLNVYKSVEFIINIYYDKDSNVIKQNIEYTISVATSSFILLHHIFCEIFYKLFELIEQGVYRKQIGITDADYNRICDEIYKRNIDECFEIIKDRNINIAEKNAAIVNKFILQDTKYIKKFTDENESDIRSIMIKKNIDKFINHNEKIL
jgi:hypothetical protein